ncbi:MAG: ECF transporter S component [Bulleidia sp.]
MKDMKKLVLSGMFLALGIVLPFLTGNIPQIGSMMCPMHIPVLLCGFICGWKYGMVVGLITPLLRSAMFGMPPMFPSAVGMAFELMTYGFLSGFLYEHSRWQCVKALYRCLVLAMIGGRLVWGAAMIVLLGINGGMFTFQAFLSGALLNAVPGIAIQLVLIPAVMVALHKAGVVRFVQKTAQA